MLTKVLSHVLERGLWGIVGEYSKIISQDIKNFFPCRSFGNVDELKKSFFSIIVPNDLILIKASNGIGLFKFTKYLQNNFNYRS